MTIACVSCVADEGPGTGKTRPAVTPVRRSHATDHSLQVDSDSHQFRKAVKFTEYQSPVFSHNTQGLQPLGIQER